MAWLVAYNEGFLDHLVGTALQSSLAELLRWALAGGPGLAAPREDWRDAVSGLLREKGHEPPA
jgi:hypothetical protein